MADFNLEAMSLKELRKLDPDGSVGPIETVRGRGYRFTSLGLGAALHPGGRILSEFSGALQVQLVFKLFPIVLDGLDAQMQFLGDLAGLLPLTDQLQDLEFPVA